MVVVQQSYQPNAHVITLWLDADLVIDLLPFSAYASSVLQHNTLKVLSLNEEQGKLKNALYQLPTVVVF